MIWARRRQPTAGECATCSPSGRPAASSRSVQPNPATSSPTFSLPEYAQATEDLTDPEYRRRIHLWAERWRERGWPTSPDATECTPQYLLDSYPGTLDSEPSRLAALVSDPGWVDVAIQSMGPDRVLADLGRAAGSDSAESAVGAILATVSGQAYHFLRSQSPLTQPGYVLRQLWMQAAELGEDRLASDLRARLRTQPDPALIPIWTTRRTSRALAAELGRHNSMVGAVAVLADGRVVSGGDDHRVLVWDPARPGTGPVELGRHEDWVTAVAVLPDGRVVSGGLDDWVVVWSTTAQGQVAQLGCSAIGLAAVQVSRGEASLVVVHEGHGFSLWSVARDDNEPAEQSKLNP
jgi:hypothetical protein